jgi:hypothetical protein
MIFIANGANASANNIGQISIKTVDDISAATTALLTFYGKAWGDSQKVAIDDFFIAFNAASWRSKVKVMVMPILMPIENAIVNTRFKTVGSIFDKNLADQATPLIAASQFLLADYGFLGISQNGFVLQNATTGTTPGTIYSNNGAGYNTNTFGITNKSAHHGVYALASTKFRVGNASLIQGYLSATATLTQYMFYNSLQTGSVAKAAPHKGLYVLNGSVPLAAGKSYIKDVLVPTTITGTATQTTLSIADVISGGTSDVVANDSTTSFMTFGEYLTDSEITEYAGIINKLMGVLVV